MRYIIALLPTEVNLFIEEAQKFSLIASDYLLSYESLPHITLAQFDLINFVKIPEIWNTIKEHNSNIIQPKFIGFSFTKKFNNLWNFSLMIERSSDLIELHMRIVDILKKFNIECINAVGELYRPHLTLVRIKELKIDGFNEKLLENKEFFLAMGEGDVNGQFKKKI